MNVCAKHALMPVIVICVECIWLQTRQPKDQSQQGMMSFASDEGTHCSAILTNLKASCALIKRA